MVVWRRIQKRRSSTRRSSSSMQPQRRHCFSSAKSRFTGTVAHIDRPQLRQASLGTGKCYSKPRFPAAGPPFGQKRGADANNAN